MRSVKVVEKKFELVARFCEVAHPVSGQSIFPTFRDFACFAAVVGYETGKRLPLGDKTRDLVDGRIFTRDDFAVDLLYLLALASTQDVAVLRDESDESVTTIFEEYLNGGLETIEAWLRDTPEDTAGDRALLSALTTAGYLSSSETIRGAADVVF